MCRHYYHADMARRTSSASTGWWPGGAQDGRGLDMEKWTQMKSDETDETRADFVEVFWVDVEVLDHGEWEACALSLRVSFGGCSAGPKDWVYNTCRSLRRNGVSCFSYVSIIFRIHSFYVVFVQVNMETEAAVSTADTDQQISAVFANFGRFTAYYGACGILWHLVAVRRLWFPDFHAAPRMLRTSSRMWRSENVQIAGRLLNGPQSRMASTSVPCQNFGRAFTRTRHFAMVNGLSAESATTMYYTSRTIVYRSVRLVSHNWSRKSVLDVLSIVEVYSHV